MGDVPVDVDLDPGSMEFIGHRFERFEELRRTCPVAFDGAHGGFWLVTDYDNVVAVANDNETFAHKYEVDAPDGVTYHGICGIPRVPNNPRLGVAEIDGPDHHDLRRALNAVFAPPAVERLRPTMERITTWFLDQHIQSGAVDLVLDFTSPVPAVLTLQMMGLPCGNWEHYAEFFHASSAHPNGSPGYLAATARAPEMMAELLEYVGYRRAHLGEDLTSLLLRLELSGRALTDLDVAEILWNLVGGGLDTTTALTSWALHHLGTHPEARERLIAEPALMPTAVEEFLRYYSPNENLTRTASRDVELGGRRIRRGDRVWISWVSGNHDARAFDAADEIVLDRSPNRHLAFGLGGHRCIGSHLARAETTVMLREVLQRIPAYEIDLERFQPYPGNPLMTGVVTMPATFAPGPVAGPPERPF
jgi:cytochrome P450